MTRNRAGRTLALLAIGLVAALPCPDAHGGDGAPAGGASPRVPETRELRRQDTGQSRALLESEADRAHRDGDAAREAQLLHELSAVLIEQGEFELAIRTADRVEDVARGIPDLSLEAWGMGARGDALFFLGDYPAAAREFEGMLERMTEAEDAFGVATALKNLGIMDKYQGDYEGGVARLEAARDAFRRMGMEIELVSTLESLGGAWIRLGDRGRALRTFQEGLEAARRLDDRRLIQQLQIRMGVLFLESDQPELALAPIGEALAIIRDLEMPIQEIWARSVKAGALEMLGRMDEAIAVAEGSLEIARRQDSPAVTAGALQTLGSLYARRDGHRSLDLLDDAAAILEGQSLPVGWFLHWDMARAYRTLGELDRAVELYSLAIEEIESQRGRLASPAHRSGFIERHRQVYQELIDVLLERGRRGDDDDRARAFRTLERRKARTLVEGIIESRADVGWPLDPDLAGRRRELEARIRETHAQLLQGRGTPATRRRLGTELDDAEEELLALIDEIRRRNPRYALIRYPEPLSVEEAQALLGPDTALLEFADTGTALHAFLLTRSSWEAFRLEATPEDVSHRVRNYVELLAKGERADWQPVGRRLYMDLVEPIRSSLPPGTRHVVVVPDGPLHFLPFETLPSATRGDGKPVFLLEDLSISYVPSATALAQMERIPVAGERADLLVFANPQGVGTDRPSPTREMFEDEGLAIRPIPHSAAEAEALRRLAAPDSEFYLGEEASEARVKSLPLGRFRVIHFATHGLVSQRRPGQSALLLSPGDGAREDGFLQVREVYAMRLASDLVVLSACRTARGRVLAGEGVQGLAQAFLHAGSDSVVASLWDVDDDRTATLMAEFYEALANGRTVADALREAKLAMLSEVGPDEPRLWAPFIAIGAADRSIALTGAAGWPAWVPWSVAVGVLLLGSFTLLRSRRPAAARDRRPPPLLSS